MTPRDLAASYIQEAARLLPKGDYVAHLCAALEMACEDQGRGFNRFSPPAVPPLKLDTEKGL